MVSFAKQRSNHRRLWPNDERAEPEIINNGCREYGLVGAVIATTVQQTKVLYGTGLYIR